MAFFSISSRRNYPYLPVIGGQSLFTAMGYDVQRGRLILGNGRSLHAACQRPFEAGAYRLLQKGWRNLLADSDHPARPAQRVLPGSPGDFHRTETKKSHNPGSVPRQGGSVPRCAQASFPVAHASGRRGPEAEAAPQASLWHTMKQVERTL